MNRSSDFVIAVPATTANFGSGFDSIGMALDLWNTLNVSISDINLMSVEGEGADLLPKDKENLVFQSIDAGCNMAGIQTPLLSIHSKNNIPLTRGLGSSAAAVVAGLLIANYYADNTLTLKNLLEIASKIEGHPDNVAPALFGGVRLIVKTEGNYIDRAIAMQDGLECLIFIPNEILATSESRSALPQKVSLESAVFNLSRTALTIRSLMTGEWEDLGIATEDRLHQDYRFKLSPNMESMISAMKNHGVYGSFISGAGPSVIGFASSDQVADIKYRLEEHIKIHKIDGRFLSIGPSHKGAHIMGEEIGS